MLPNLNVNEIFHRIGNQLPLTDYKPDTVKALILSIDGINLSDSALETRTSKIIEAHRRLQQELQRLHSSHVSPSRSRSVPLEPDSTISIGSDEFYARLVRRQPSSKEHLLIPGGGLRGYASAQEVCSFRPVQGHQSSALETLRMIEYQRSPEQRPKQQPRSRNQHATHQEHRYHPVQVHQRSSGDTIRMLIDRGAFDHRSEQRSTSLQHASAHKHQSPSKTGHLNSHESRPHPDVSREHGLSKTGAFNTRSHPQHVVHSSTSTKRRPERSIPTQLAKRPRPQRGAYSIENLRGGDDGSDMSSDEIECSDGSEYCDDDA